jgi:hypothetical protein
MVIHNHHRERGNMLAMKSTKRSQTASSRNETQNQERRPQNDALGLDLSLGFKFLCTIIFTINE